MEDKTIFKFVGFCSGFIGAFFIYKGDFNPISFILILLSFLIWMEKMIFMGFMKYLYGLMMHDAWVNLRKCQIDKAIKEELNEQARNDVNKLLEEI